MWVELEEIIRETVKLLRPMVLCPYQLIPSLSPSYNTVRFSEMKIIKLRPSKIGLRADQISSVAQSFPTLWDPMDCSTPGFPVCHQLLELVLKLMSIKSVMPSNHRILCRPLLLPSMFPSIRVFSNESALRIRWPDYWSFSLSGCGSSSFYFCHMSHLLGISSYVSSFRYILIQIYL